MVDLEPQVFNKTPALAAAIPCSTGTKKKALQAFRGLSFMAIIHSLSIYLCCRWFLLASYKAVSPISLALPYLLQSIVVNMNMDIAI